MGIADDQESIEKTRKLHLASEARRILSEPLIDNFLRDQEAMCFEAFKQLPLDANLDEFKTIYHEVRAVNKFRVKLQTYINEADIMTYQDNRNVAEEI